MSVIDLTARVHDCAAVLEDLTRVLREEPNWGRDGILVILLEGNSYCTKTLSSDMRRMDAVALLEAIKFDMIATVRGVRA